jgi:hypothetical protein
VLTADCTMEQNISSHDMMTVDSGTQAGSHVPVGVLFSISMDSPSCQNRVRFEVEVGNHFGRPARRPSPD